MRTLYIECAMGAAGDMLLAALWELLPNQYGFLNKMNELGLPGVQISVAPAVRCGVTGSHMTVKIFGQEEDGHRHGHGHSTLQDIHHCIDHLALPQSVKDNAKAVYDRIARAESQVHGQTVEAVHFHEVGAWDAVADVVGVCLAMEWLKPEQIVVSPVHVGSGHVRCAHGLLPVPAPATALLLKDVPIYGGQVLGELCTPTGAALLTHFADRFGEMPVMATEKVGYGMGTKEFERANCVRVFLGETCEQPETVAELICNLDDMTGEAIGFAMEILLDSGALDVFTCPIGMKKSRPATMLTVLCKACDADRMAALMLRHTTTLGVRKHLCQRYTLHRRISTVETPYGAIRIKEAEGYGVSKSKPEYEDVAKAANEHAVSFSEILRSL